MHNARMLHRLIVKPRLAGWLAITLECYATHIIEAHNMHGDLE